MKPASRQDGFTLIEVLVALLILAVGLLGTASLMLLSMQSNQGAAQRSAAIVLSYDLIERMRSNRDQAALAASPFDGDPADAVDPCPAPIADSCPAGMTAAEQATHDLALWTNVLTNAIPGAQAAIQQQGTSSEYCIVIFWPENQSDLVDAAATACGEDAAGRAFTNLDVTI